MMYMSSAYFSLIGYYRVIDNFSNATIEGIDSDDLLYGVSCNIKNASVVDEHLSKIIFGVGDVGSPEKELKRIPVSYTHLTLPTKRIV